MVDRVALEIVPIAEEITVVNENIGKFITNMQKPIVTCCIVQSIVLRTMNVSFAVGYFTTINSTEVIGSLSPKMSIQIPFELVETLSARNEGVVRAVSLLYLDLPPIVDPQQNI